MNTHGVRWQNEEPGSARHASRPCAHHIIMIHAALRAIASRGSPCAVEEAPAPAATPLPRLVCSFVYRPPRSLYPHLLWPCGGYREAGTAQGARDRHRVQRSSALVIAP